MAHPGFKTAVFPTASILPILISSSSPKLTTSLFAVVILNEAFQVKSC